MSRDTGLLAQQWGGAPPWTDKDRPGVASHSAPQYRLWRFLSGVRTEINLVSKVVKSF